MPMIKHRLSLKHINRPCKEELIKLSWTHSRVLCGNYSNSKHFISDLSLQSLPRNSLLYFCFPVVHSINDFKLEITPWRRIRTISDVSCELQVKGNATEIGGGGGIQGPWRVFIIIKVKTLASDFCQLAKIIIKILIIIWVLLSIYDDYFKLFSLDTSIRWIKHIAL